MPPKKTALIIGLFLMGQFLPALARAAAACINLNRIALLPLRQLAFGAAAYLFQFGLTILALLAWPSLTLRRAGLSLNNLTLSFALLRRFLLTWGGLVICFFAVALVWLPWFGPYLQAQCPTNGLNLLKDILIGVILAPPAEELLYRGLLLGALGGAGRWSLLGGRVVVSGAALFSGVTFMAAHIGLQLLPTFASPILTRFNCRLPFCWAAFGAGPLKRPAACSARCWPTPVPMPFSSQSGI